MPVRSSKDVVESIFGPIGPVQARQQEAMKTLETLQVRDVMERHFVILHPQTTLREAIGVFVEKGIEGAPIVQDVALKGILTNQDIVKLFEEKSLELSQHRHRAVNYEKEFRALGDKKVAEIGRRKISVFPNTSIFDAMTVMEENNLELIAVTDEAGAVRGIVNDSDILKTLMKILV
ncbi:MAG: CBS domain-containing protein [Candidatus Aenigmarchaeota archaeon]|nr:CBS domain-containing protein [Candidatus Aenigmarchaeota archaeon]